MLSKVLQRLKRLLSFPGGDRGPDPSNSDIPKGFFGHVSWQYGGMVTVSVIGFFYAMLAGNGLGAGNFGLIAQGLAFAAIVSRLVHLALGEFTICYISRFQAEDDLPRVLATAKLSLLLDVIGGMCAMILIMALAPLAKAHMMDGDRRAYLVLALCGATFVLQNVADDTAKGVLRMYSRFRDMAFVETAAAVFKLGGVVIVLWVLDGGILGVMLVLLATNLLMNGSLLALAFRSLHKQISLRSHAPLALLAPYRAEMTLFLRQNYFRSLTALGSRDLDINILGFFSTRETIGVYKMAKQFLTVLQQVPHAVFMVIYPEVARLWATKKRVALFGFIRRISLVMIGASSLFYAVSFFVVPFVVQTFLKKEYAGAGALFRYMGWGIVPISALLWLPALLTASGRLDLRLLSNILGALTGLVLYAVLISMLDATGAALVTAAGTPLTATLGCVLAWRAGLLNADEETIRNE